MKIEKINILSICNYSHPNFGIFASFLDGLGKGDSIDIPQGVELFLCKECGAVSPLEGVCFVCSGKGKDPLSHEHTWTVKKRVHCIKCGIYKDFFEKKIKR